MFQRTRIDYCYIRVVAFQTRRSHWATNNTNNRLIPWQTSLSLTWDVTVATTLEDSYISTSASSVGAAAEMAASRKQAKYAALSGSYVFQPIAMETLGPINESAVQFLNDLGHKITSVSADDKEAQFLFQRLSTTVQRFNSILLQESFGNDDDPDH